MGTVADQIVDRAQAGVAVMRFAVEDPGAQLLVAIVGKGAYNRDIPDSFE